MISNAYHKLILLYCSQPTQTPDDSEAEESDFPPCLVGNCMPIMSRSPAAVPSRSRYLPAATSGSQQQLTISGKKEPQSQHRQLPNPGLGQMNVVNTTATALNKKVLVILYISYSNVINNNINVRAIVLLMDDLL